MRMYDIIAKKRDKLALNEEEFNYFINGMVDQSIGDYQVSALLMAMYLNGMEEEETALMTKAMAESGDRIDLSSIEGIKVDKHSTGGVGDKTTLVLMAICSAAGAKIAKMSGRGLGYAGGTIDKLDAIPGFQTELSKKRFTDSVNKIGAAVVSQSGDIAPADKKIYAIRDVTATVESIPLIASSIMSKKLASGADKLVLDIKVGSGAFVKNIEDALELAKVMIEIGKHNNLETVALLTDMDTPLGNGIGNLIEVKEAYAILCNEGPEDLQEVSLQLSAEILVLAGLGTIEECLEMARETIVAGSAKEKFLEIIKNQQGDTTVLDQDNTSGEGLIVKEFKAVKEGYISQMDSEHIGNASMILGAGRQTQEDEIDPSAGIILHKKTGSFVRKGDVLATLITTNKNSLSSALAHLKEAYLLVDEEVGEKPLILARATSENIEVY